MENIKILITGGCGFVGTNFIPNLIKTGYNPQNIMVFDNLSHGSYLDEIHSNVLFSKTDIRNKVEMEDVLNFFSFKPDIIFHFAGLVSIYDCNNDPKEAYDNNLMGSINIFNLALKYNAKVIFSETSAVYENVDLPENGYTEDTEDPTTVYACSKDAVATLAKSYARLNSNFKYTALRYFNVVGKLQDWKRTIPPVACGFAFRIMNDKAPIIFGDGSRRRDFIHVDDINKFHLICMTDKRTDNETFNLGRGESISLFELNELISSVLEVDTIEPIMMEQINGEAHTIFANIDKAKSLGWEPKMNLFDMHKDLIEYFKILKAKNIIPKNFMDDIDLKSVKIGK